MYGIRSEEPPVTPLEAFRSLDVRVGTVTACDAFPEARKPAWKLTIDFGPEVGTLRSSAQITGRYDADSLVGRQVLAAVNLGDRQIGPFVSQCLVLGVRDAGGAVVLVGPEAGVPDGARLE